MKEKPMPVISVLDTIKIALSVKDRHASAKWYGDMLGFETLFHADEAGWSEIQTNTSGVIIGFSEHTEPAPGNTVPVFGVADTDAARAALEAAGVKFDGDTIHVEGMVKTASFFDPDGNALMIAEDLTQAG